MNKKNIAFTMSEVMMVMGIIGVVATLTLPTLQKSSETQTNVAQAKKMFADLSTAFERANIKYGNFYNWPTTNPGTVLFKRLTKYLDVEKTCSTTAAPNDCWKASSVSANTYNSAVLSDGSSILIMNNSSSLILIDVNGPKKGSSKNGSDIFNLYTKSDISGSSLQGFSGSTVPTSTTTIGTTNYLYWVLTYGNEDYLTCASSLKFDTTTTCR